jgi:hypothetical protein
MTKIAIITYSGGVCPYELEAITCCNRSIYLRYRDGLLRWGFLDDKNKILPVKYEFEQKIGDHLDWFPDDKLFKLKLAESLEFPDNFVFEQK